ncbi:hypothetical protein AUV02_05800 [Micrococcus sp. CH3]|nr:hypothetical protein AUV02_05800 [Micrococcus sp. CH3]
MRLPSGRWVVVVEWRVREGPRRVSLGTTVGFLAPRLARTGTILPAALRRRRGALETAPVSCSSVSASR